MIDLPTFDNVLVTGNQTIQQNLQVDQNATIQNLNVTGSETISGHLQVNGSASVLNHLNVGGTVTVGGNVFTSGTAGAAQRVSSSNLPAVPPGVPNLQTVRFYPTGAVNQPGLQLKGTDGLDYVLFIVIAGGLPHIGIQRA
ncbi:hypothetical protein [Fontibacillus sp. BL9]|uniref:hypothetical protein n=1 Tax=Fontibacillus sp. BL9 TaxID=3389971 RepID=UPI00397A9DC2